MPDAVFTVKRRYPRFTCSAEAEAVLRDGTSIPAQVLELSSQGCYIDATKPVSVGSELSLEVDIEISEGVRKCELPGKVIYLHEGFGLGICGIGVIFGDLAANERSKVDEWLRELATRQAQKALS